MSVLPHMSRQCRYVLINPRESAAAAWRGKGYSSQPPSLFPLAASEWKAGTRPSQLASALSPFWGWTQGEPAGRASTPGFQAKLASFQDGSLQSPSLGGCPNGNNSPVNAVCCSLPLCSTGMLLLEASGFTSSHHESAGSSSPSYVVSLGSGRKYHLLCLDSLFKCLSVLRFWLQFLLQILPDQRDLLFCFFSPHVLIFLCLDTKSWRGSFSTTYVSPYSWNSSPNKILKTNMVD